MGHELPPERTFSWDELGRQPVGPDGQEELSRPGSMAWRIVAALMFVNGLALLGYACKDGYWYLWVAALVAFGIVGAMASRAVANMVRDGELDSVAPPSMRPDFTSPFMRG